MKKIIFLLLSIVLTHAAFCQKKTKPEEAFYMLDENMKATSQEKAVHFIHVFKIHDSCWQFDTYNIFGPIISSGQYKTDKGTGAAGMFCYYNKKGKMDSSGNYLNGFQDGSWYFINDTGHYYLQKDYAAGKLISVKDILKIDSVKTQMEKTAVKLATDETETEADFVGGQSRWIYYLGKNMKYPERALKANKQGTVIVQFVIDPEGNVILPEIVKSVEYSIDQEALRLIKNSPTWTPAVQNGKNVKAYKMQPITFKFESN